MGTSKNIPKGWLKALQRKKELTYKINVKSDYYELYIRYKGFGKMPEEIKVERSIREDYIRYGANFIARSRQKNNIRIVHTGLIPTQFESIFLGDFIEIKDDGNKKKSLLLFRFSEDLDLMKVHFFQSFKVYPKSRKKFVRAFAEYCIEERAKKEKKLLSVGLTSDIGK